MMTSRQAGAAAGFGIVGHEGSAKPPRPGTRAERAEDQDTPQSADRNDRVSSVVFTLDADLYEVDVILRAAYRFIDCYYVSFSSCEPHHIEARFEAKAASTCGRHELVGEFHNELLHCRLRRSVASQTKTIRELILGRALFGTCIELDEYETTDVKTASETHSHGRAAQTGYAEDSAGIARDWFS
jgi:His-Xaa-Ser system protein HxsD